MSDRISATLLWRLRNEIDIAALIQEDLDLQWKLRDGYVRFCCPLCSDFHTATNAKTNLGRCFRCKQNYNPIDLVMLAANEDFLGAVAYLKRRLGEQGEARGEEHID